MSLSCLAAKHFAWSCDPELFGVVSDLASGFSVGQSASMARTKEHHDQNVSFY